MPKHTYDYVKTYIEDSGDELISEEYIDSKTKLDIKCPYCEEIFKCPFTGYQQGKRHTGCKNEHLRTEKYQEMRNPRSKVERKKTEEIKCQFCFKLFKQKYSKQKLCNNECKKGFEQTKKGTGVYEENGRKGGLISAKIQVRRSFNEIYFSELCKKVFKTVLTNEPIFDGWDCDVIIQELKISISYDGIWHSKQVRKDHNLKQVQSRDKIKDKIIREKYCYDHYIITDTGKKNKSFVINEFNKFIEYVNEKYNYNITLNDYEVDMSDYKNHKVIKKQKEKNKCIDCNKDINRNSKRCIPCDKIKQRKCERPSLKTLIEEVNQLGYVGTGKKYSVTDNAIRKWIINYKKEEKGQEIK